MKIYLALAARVLWFCFACVGSPVFAHAWGADGHRIVAAIAQRHLTAAAQQQISALLAVDGSADLPSIATWADEIRGDNRSTAPWHYVQLGPGCHYDLAQCRDGQCIVAAIQRFTGVLGDHTASDHDRAEALKWVVHLAGDASMPLHASDHTDKGGNQYQVNVDGMGTNLHKVWDSMILATTQRPWTATVSIIDTALGPAAPITSDLASSWVEQACSVIDTAAIYPSGHVIDYEYETRSVPVVYSQLRLAGLRLAGLLNSTLQ